MVAISVTVAIARNTTIALKWLHYNYQIKAQSMAQFWLWLNSCRFCTFCIAEHSTSLPWWKGTWTEPRNLTKNRSIQPSLWTRKADITNRERGSSQKVVLCGKPSMSVIMYHTEVLNPFCDQGPLENPKSIHSPPIWPLNGCRVKCLPHYFSKC